jgi:regulatory LuxR family protein
MLRPAAQGLPNNEVAGPGISESTVKVHIGSTFRRVGVQARSLLRYGLKGTERSGQKLTGSDRTAESVRTGLWLEPGRGYTRQWLWLTPKSNLASIRSRTVPNLGSIE